MGYDVAQLMRDALEKTNGDANPTKLLAAMQGHSWNSPRGPVTLAPEYNDVVQNMYVAEVRRVAGRLQNVVIDTVPDVRPV